jgi:GT2 family glycosyltransferase
MECLYYVYATNKLFCEVACFVRTLLYMLALCLWTQPARAHATRVIVRPQHKPVHTQLCILARDTR